MTTVALIAVPWLLMLGLSLAPMSFWHGLNDYDRTLTCWLWGFSHPFGPPLKLGEPPPWEDP